MGSFWFGFSVGVLSVIVVVVAIMVIMCLLSRYDPPPAGDLT